MSTPPLSLRERLVFMLRTIFRRHPRAPSAPPPSLDPPPEDALVPVGPHRRPPLAGGAELPLPQPEPRDVEAYGRPLPDD